MLPLVPLAMSMLMTMTASIKSAQACSPDRAERSARVEALQTTAWVGDDRSSKVACEPHQGASCGRDIRYEGVQKLLDVKPVLTKQTSNPRSLIVGKTSGDVLYELRDASGNVLMTQEGDLNGTTFAAPVLGATVCVKSLGVLKPPTSQSNAESNAEADGGTPPRAKSAEEEKAEAERSGANGEVCSPVTVTSLQITEEDEDAHEDSVSKDCGGLAGCKVTSTNSKPFHRRDFTLPLACCLALVIARVVRQRR
jgi:hypothetical protein